MVKLVHSDKTHVMRSTIISANATANWGQSHISEGLGDGRKCDCPKCRRTRLAAILLEYIRPRVYLHSLNLCIMLSVFVSVFGWAHWRDWVVFLAICAVYVTIVITKWRVYMILKVLRQLDESLSHQNKNSN